MCIYISLLLLIASIGGDIIIIILVKRMLKHKELSKLPEITYLESRTQMLQLQNIYFESLHCLKTNKSSKIKGNEQVLYQGQPKDIKLVNPKGNQSWIFIVRTDAEAPIHWHLMQRAYSLEKNLMLGKIEGRRRRGWQRIKWLDSIIDPMDMSLSILWEMVKDRKTWCAVVHGVTESWMWLSDWTTTINIYTNSVILILKSEADIQVGNF